MIVIEELKKTLFGAEILYRMFSRARKQICDRKSAAYTAAPLISQVEPCSPPGTTMIDLMTDGPQNEFPSTVDGFDAFSTIWNPESLMLTCGLTYEAG